MLPKFFRTEGVPPGFVMIQQDDTMLMNVRKSAITVVGFSPKAARTVLVKMACGTEFKGFATEEEVKEFLRVIATDEIPRLVPDGPTVKKEVFTLGNPVEKEAPYFCGAACLHYMQITNLAPSVRHPFNTDALRRVTNAKSADAALTGLADCEAS